MVGGHYLNFVVSMEDQHVIRFPFCHNFSMEVCLNIKAGTLRMLAAEKS